MPGKFNKELWDFGKQIEDNVMPQLNNLFDADFCRDDNIFDVLDFHDNNKKIICEIKGRKIAHDKWEDTIIPMNKIWEGFKKIDMGYKVYFVFVFTDKTKYIELSDELKYQVKLTGTNCIEHALIRVADLQDLPQD